MDAVDVFIMIILIGVVLVGVSACIMASKWDEIEEEQWEKMEHEESKRIKGNQTR